MPITGRIQVPEPRGPFSYETIADKSARTGFHYRIRDADDNRIATSYDEDHAAFIVRRLNGQP